jgi:hypothetical protein
MGCRGEEGYRGPDMSASARRLAILTSSLVRMRPVFSASTHCLLTALVEALNSPDKLSALDQFPLWRDAKPSPLE